MRITGSTKLFVNILTTIPIALPFFLKMHFAKILASLAFISLTSAFKVPEGTTDGFYKAYISAQGEEIHERVSNVKDHAAWPTIPEAKVPEGSALDKRQNGERYYSTHCGCGIELNHTNCDDAVQDLKNQMYDILGTFQLKLPSTPFVMMLWPSAVISLLPLGTDSRLSL